MSYAEQQRDPRKHLAGIGAVIVFHAALIYGLTNGLARKVVDVLKSPLSVNIVEEIKPLPPPPPPPKAVPLPTKVAAPPPPAYVPPVEVPVQAPPQNVIAATTHTPPPAAPAAPPAPAAPAGPAVANISVACPNHADVRSQVPYPRQAERMGLSGSVEVEFTVGAGGEIKDVTVVRSTHSVFNGTATAAVAKLRCVGQGRDVRVAVPFVFNFGG